MAGGNQVVVDVARDPVPVPAGADAAAGADGGALPQAVDPDHAAVLVQRPPVGAGRPGQVGAEPAVRRAVTGLAADAVGAGIDHRGGRVLIGQTRVAVAAEAAPVLPGRRGIVQALHDQRRGIPDQRLVGAAVDVAGARDGGGPAPGVGGAPVGVGGDAGAVAAHRGAADAPWPARRLLRSGARLGRGARPGGRPAGGEAQQRRRSERQPQGSRMSHFFSASGGLAPAALRR